LTSALATPVDGMVSIKTSYGASFPQKSSRSLSPRQERAFQVVSSPASRITDASPSMGRADILGAPGRRSPVAVRMCSRARRVHRKRRSSTGAGAVGWPDRVAGPGRRGMSRARGLTELRPRIRATPRARRVLRVDRTRCDLGTVGKAEVANPGVGALSAVSTRVDRFAMAGVLRQ
jgi:hypothetical protein